MRRDEYAGRCAGYTARGGAGYWAIVGGRSADFLFVSFICTWIRKRTDERKVKRNPPNPSNG